MSNAVERKPIWQNEDWMATFIGLFIINKVPSSA